MRIASRSSGFTLIELMIGVSIMAGIVASAYLSLQAAYRTRATVEVRSDIVQQARVVLDILAQDLRHAAPPTEEFLFVGMVREQGDEAFGNLDFVSHHWKPLLEGEGDRCEISLFVDRDPETEQWLLIRRRDPSPDLEPFEGGTREVIARGLRGFRLEYYDGYEWVESWGEEDDEGNRVGYPTRPDPTTSSSDEENSGDANADGAIDPESPEDEFPSGPVYGRSGLPEAVRVVIAFDPPGVDREKLSSEELSETRPLVFEAIVRLELAGREPDPGLLGSSPDDIDSPIGDGPNGLTPTTGNGGW